MGSTSSLDRLQKEIDALTYNARSVLQALQESTVTAGSSKGFKVIRSGKEILLTRVDIYRLYKFYQEWEANDFSLVDVIATVSSPALKGFDTIRIEQDNTFVRDDYGNPTDKQATTTALAKHGRMLYLTGDNVGSYDNETYWYGLIASAANPKMAASSAPVPINLRTPIFDPNLSTTHYNTHPTYLFPMGYYRMDLLGYADDGVDHYLGGHSWSVVGDSHARIESVRPAIGMVDPAAQRRTKDNRVGDNSLVWGYDTQANNTYATAGGLHSIASANGSTAIGSYAYASGEFSSAIGGSNNFAVNIACGILGGFGNVGGGRAAGILGGMNNTTGEPAYTFSVVATSGSASECTIEIINNCIGTDTTIGSSTAGIPGYDSIVIDANISTLNWGEGDTVSLFALTTMTSTGLTKQWIDQVGGTGFATQSYTIASIAADPVNSSKTNVRLKESVPKTYIDGGRITRHASASTTNIFGYCSATVGGTGLIANGYYQTIVGKYNKINMGAYLNRRDARFVVGIGTSDTARANALEVYDNTVIMYANPASEYGTSGFDGIASDPSVKRLQTAQSDLIVTSNFIRATASYQTSQSSMKLSADTAIPYSILTSDRVGLIAQEYTDITTKAPGAFLAGPAVGIEGNNVGINASADIHVTAGGILQLAADQLIITPETNTFNTLPLTGSSTMHSLSLGGIDFLQASAFCTVDVSAFDTGVGYKIPTSDHLGLGPVYILTGGTGAVTLLNYSTDTKTDGYACNLQMVWGEAVANNPGMGGSNTIPTGNIAVRKGRVNATNPTTDSHYTQWEYLAKLSDLDAQKKSFGTKTTQIVFCEIYALYYSGGFPNPVTSEHIDRSKYTISEGTVSRSGDISFEHIQIDFLAGFLSSGTQSIHTFLIYFNVDSADSDYFIPKYRTSGTYVNRTSSKTSGRIDVFNDTSLHVPGDAAGYNIHDYTMINQLTPSEESGGVWSSAASYSVELNIPYKNRVVTT